MESDFTTIDVIDKPTPKEFYQEYWLKHRPVIINGIISEWPAMSLWTLDYFKLKFGSMPIRYERGKSDEFVKDPIRFLESDQTFVDASLRDYIEKIQGPSPDLGRTHYLAEFPIFDVIPELINNIKPLDDYMCMPKFYPQYLKQKLKLKPRFWLGPKDSLSSLHFDMPFNFFVQIYGRKQWTIIPPTQSKNLYYPCSQLTSQFLHWSPVDIEFPDLERFPLFAHVKPIRFIVEPGQMLFIPCSWWHHVRSLEASISLNFFWFEPLHNLWPLRKYLFHRSRRKILNLLGLKKFIPYAEA